MLTKKARLFLGLTAATPLLFAACTDNGIFNPLNDAAGRYQLSIYADNRVPVTFTVAPGDDPDIPNGGRWTISIDTRNTLVLRSDRSFTETNFITKTPTGGPSFETSFISSGTFTINGNSIDFSTPDGRFFSGTVASDRINYHELDAATQQTFLYEYDR